MGVSGQAGGGVMKGALVRLLQGGLLAGWVGCAWPGTGPVQGSSAIVTPATAMGGGPALKPASAIAEASELGDSRVLKVRLLAFNDFHGQLEPEGLSLRLRTPQSMTVPAGGAAWLAGMLDRLRGEVRHSITVSGGDLVGASPLVSAAQEDSPTTQVINAIGLVLAGVGQHEVCPSPP